MNTTVRVLSTEVHGRLEELGLTTAMLADVVRQGHHVFISATSNDPPLYPGFSAWARMVRALREYLLPAGWERSDENNYSLVVSPNGAMAIAVATGDDVTGDATASPTTKSSKGPSTVEAVASNQVQLSLPFDLPPFPAPARPLDASRERMTWILLVHRSTNEVRCELSLPMSMGTDGRIDAWRERIIIGAFPTDPALVEIVTPQPDLPDITIDIKRRA